MSSASALQREVSSLLSLHQSNAATIATLTATLDAQTSHVHHLTSHLQSQLSHRLHSISRLETLLASLSSSHHRTASSLLAAYEATLASAHSSLTSAQSAHASSYQSLLSSLSSSAPLIHRRARLESDLSSLQSQVVADEARRLAEFEATKARFERQHSAHQALTSTSPLDRLQRDDAFRRRVVRSIEGEKAALLGQYEEARRSRLQRRDDMQRTHQQLRDLTQLHARLVRDRELRDGEGRLHAAVVRGRERRVEEAEGRKAEVEEETLEAVMRPDSPGSPEGLPGEGEEEECSAEVEALRAEWEAVEAETREWRRRGARLLKEFRDVSELYHGLMEGVEAEEGGGGGGRGREARRRGR